VKLVFPPVNKIAAVPACKMKNARCPAALPPKTRLASWTMTVRKPAAYGVAWVACASQEIPAIKNATSEPWIASS
jgi:hypothetical protein